MRLHFALALTALALFPWILPQPLSAQLLSPQLRAGAASGPEKIIFDTDIGDDIDDAFALALALRSPELKILGVTTAWGDTGLRARLVQRLLCESGDTDIPVHAGLQTKPAANAPFSQARWASRLPEPKNSWPSALDFLLEQIRSSPGEITLISVSPLSNVGALIDRDPENFRKLKRVVIMGGSVRKGYGDLGYLPDHGPDPEYNIVMDISSAKKLFSSGVPLYVLPLDATQIKLDEVKRTALFSADTPLTNALDTLYQQWSMATGNTTPTLFDVVAVLKALDPLSCPDRLLHLTVDDKGYTRETPGEANAHVCLQPPDMEKAFDLLLHRLQAQPKNSGASSQKCMAYAY